ncbi:hypothetical protein [Streptomyces sp. NPDC029003]|uniref:hypothetical protein n=1 Tax=Streptomyces sp. NPDC029003 TaxID=3155125 RepID=UPI0033EFD1ED
MAAARPRREIPQRNPFERADAEPMPGCDVCAALVEQRAEYRRLRCASGASDCDIEIRQHPRGVVA